VQSRGYKPVRAGGTERRPDSSPALRHLSERQAVASAGAGDGPPLGGLADAAASHDVMRTTFRAEVVPRVVLYRIDRITQVGLRRRPKSRDADERGEVAVLVRQLDEFDAAFAALERVEEAGGLRRPDRRIPELLPHAEQRAKPRRAVGERQGSQLRIGRRGRRLPAPLPLAKDRAQSLGIRGRERRGERLAGGLAEQPNRRSGGRRDEHAYRPAVQPPKYLGVPQEKEPEVHRNWARHEVHEHVPPRK